MPRLAMSIVVFVALAFGSVALARGIIWEGQYQRIEKGANVEMAAATLRLTGNPKRPAGYECTYSLQGAEKTVSFTMAQCTRTGSHVVCSTEPEKSKGPFTGAMCWGEIYLKKPHPSELGK